MPAPTIYIQNASLSFSGKTVFSDLSLTLTAGKWIGLLGPSGIGKSSLLRIIAGLETSEEIVSGKIFSEPSIVLEEQIAYMAQTDLLLPWLNVLQNAALGLKLRSHTRKAYATHLHEASQRLIQVGLGDVLHFYPSQLSGGMRQRVALVRTLMENKPIVLMDEPFSALDAITRHQLQALAADLLKDKTVLFITHDPYEALRLADDIYVMRGTPTTLTYVATLTSPSPRSLEDADMIALQKKLYATLGGG